MTDLDGETDLQLLLDHLRRQQPTRALLIGTPDDVSPILDRIRAHCRWPLTHLRPSEPLPRANTGALMVHDVSTLTRDAQLKFLAWMDEHGPYWTVLAASDRSLFPLVERGAFTPALFYRLNILSINCSQRSGG